MSAALTLAVSFTGHPEVPLMIGGGAVAVAAALWPGRGSALSVIRRLRLTRVPRPPAAQLPEPREPAPRPGAVRLP